MGNEQLKKDARYLAQILIQLQQEYPLFFTDVADGHPDLDQEKGFKTYEKLMREKDATRFNKFQRRW